MEEILGTLRRNGFSPEMTHHAYHALDSHITGFTLWLVNLPARGDELLEMAASARQRIPIEVFPWTIEHIDYHISPPPAGVHRERIRVWARPASWRAWSGGARAPEPVANALDCSADVLIAQSAGRVPQTP